MATLLNVLRIHKEFTVWPNPPNVGTVPEGIGFADSAPAERSQSGILQLGYDRKAPK
jgi:hypothetical protein